MRTGEGTKGVFPLPLQNLSPSQRSLISRIGANEMHARHDVMRTSAPGRAAARTKLETQLLEKIDPDGKLAPPERARRLEHARKAHFQGLAYRRMKQGRAR